MDCILGYHLSPFTCGIARFNHVLGREMGVPVLSLFAPDAMRYGHVLLSIKHSEFSSADSDRLRDYLARRPAAQKLDLFLHDYDDSPIERLLLDAADNVYVGNAQLAGLLRPHHRSVVEAWCPGALLEAHEFPRTDISIFSFGMAHKVRAAKYRRLKELLDRTGCTYTIYLSTALHEGTDFESSFTGAFDELTAIFEGRVNFLGFLSDAAVFNYLRSSTFFSAFFPEGVRANNTSVHTAMQCGSVVITNLDEFSPPEYRHSVNVIDIDRACDLPIDKMALNDIASAGQEVAARYGWSNLVSLLRAPDQAGR